MFRMQQLRLFTYQAEEIKVCKQAPPYRYMLNENSEKGQMLFALPTFTKAANSVFLIRTLSLLIATVNNPPLPPDSTPQAAATYTSFTIVALNFCLQVFVVDP